MRTESGRPPSTDPGENLLRSVCHAGRAAVLAATSADTCILTTRVICETARYFGVPVKPVAVNVMVHNAAAARLLAEAVPTDQWPPEAWSLGVAGTGAIAGRAWDGHLIGVGVVGGDRFLVDGSADQLSRPGKGIDVAPLTIRMPQGYRDIPAGEWMLVGNQAAVTVAYRRMATPGQWRRSPDWVGKKAAAAAMTARAITAVRAARL